VKLNQVLALAVKYGDEGSRTNAREEVGGVILQRKGWKSTVYYTSPRADYSRNTLDFIWVPLHNQHTGTPTAHGLFEATQEEFTKKAIPLLRDGWKRYATFHTHPSFSYHPSHTDLTELFKSYHINYIYSIPENCVAKYTWQGEVSLKQEITRDINKWLKLNESQ